MPANTLIAAPITELSDPRAARPCPANGEGLNIKSLALRLEHRPPFAYSAKNRWVGCPVETCGRSKNAEPSPESEKISIKLETKVGGRDLVNAVAIGGLFPRSWYAFPWTVNERCSSISWLLLPTGRKRRSVTRLRILRPSGRCQCSGLRTS